MLDMHEVIGSIPTVSTKPKRTTNVVRFLLSICMPGGESVHAFIAEEDGLRRQSVLLSCFFRLYAGHHSDRRESMEPLLYEIEHGIGTDHFMLYERENHVFPVHMHRCFEFVWMVSGEMDMRIEKQEYRLTEGDLVLIKPNRFHSYASPEGVRGKCLICVFSNDLIAAIAEPLAKYHIPSPLLHNVPTLYRDMFMSMNENKDLATVKGFLYTVCGLFYQNIDRTTEDHIAKDTVLLRDIFVYLENHISEPCTLKGTATALGYHPAYISRYFTQSVGIPFYAYVQSVKMDRACYLLINTADSILSIAIQCGFATLSSFNRTFRMTLGMTPREYRQTIHLRES